MAPLSLPEALSLLETLQIQSSTEAAKQIAALPQRLHPHPKLTEPVLELLQIHPKETLPHIPDLLPSQGVTALLQAISHLLSSDRTLLPLILGIFPSLPLTPEQSLQIRATITYALHIVDTHDIPCVVRTLASSRAPWAGDTLRKGIRLTPAIAPVISEALADQLIPSNPLAERLLNPVPPLRSVDFLFLVQALESRLAPIARRRLNTLLRTGVFARCSYPRAVACLQHVLPRFVHGANRLVIGTLMALPDCVDEVVAVARFCKRVLKTVPQAAAGVGGVVGTGAVLVQQFLLRSLNNPLLVPSGLHRTPEVAVAALGAGEHPNWAPLMISVRKGALFGSLDDFRRVEGLARCVVNEMPVDVVNELFGVLHASVGDCLSEPLAVVMLDLVGDAIMRGMDMEDIYKKRAAVLSKGLLTEDRDGISVDIGLVWEQRPASAATIISSAVAIKLAGHGTEAVARDLLRVSVLVPVVCVSLYQAVENLAWPIPLSTKNGRSKGVDIPEKVAELETTELGTAVSAFAVGMAIIVGLLNRSSQWSGIFRRVVETRHKADTDEADCKAMWMVLDRLTEFDRMRTALALAIDVLVQRWNDVRLPQKGSDRGRRRKRETVRETLERAKVVRDSILSAVEGEEVTKRRGQRETEIEFPRLSLETVVLSLASIPDEDGIASICDESLCKLSRDVELARIDKLLLFRLLRFMTLSHSSISATDGKDDGNAQSVGRNIKAADWVSQNFFDVEKLPRLGIDEIMPDFEKKLEEKEDFFFKEDEHSEDEAVEESQARSTVLWATYITNNERNDKAYLLSTAPFLLGTEAENCGEIGSNAAASVIHSPAFAALLLDRAATYVAVARKARLSGADEFFLSDAVMASGLALGCLIAVFRIIPMLPSSSVDSEPPSRETCASETGKTCCVFVNEIGKRLLVGVPPCLDAETNPGIVSEYLDTNGWKVIATLRWVAMTSIEAAVASAAVAAVSTISEYEVCDKRYARQLSFSSLTTVYEYDGGALWDDNGLNMMLRDTYSEWSLRRRISQEWMEAQADQIHAPDPYPWINIKLKKLRQKPLERQRLSLYFTGMYIPDALLEGCAWVREMSNALSAGATKRNEACTTESSKCRERERSSAHRKSVKRKRSEPRELVRKEVIICDTLLDMMGFRTIVEILIDIVVQGLQAYAVSTSLSTEDTEDEATNPLPHIRTSLGLFCGLVSLHCENRRKLIAASGGGTAPNVSVDVEFDYSMTTACIAVMQLARSRVDELLAWYSNPSTAVSQLSPETMKCIEEVIGCAAQAVNRCSEVAESIKADQGLENSDDNPAPQSRNKRARKTPGYEKRTRKRLESEELSKARRMIPKLSGQTENVAKSLQKLAKAVGVRTKQNLSGLAPLPVANDSALRFGIGLEQGFDECENDAQLGVEDSEAARSKTTAGMSSDNRADAEIEVEGFHARSGKTVNPTALQETVTVDFGRSSK